MNIKEEILGSEYTFDSYDRIIIIYIEWSWIDFSNIHAFQLKSYQISFFYFEILYIIHAIFYYTFDIEYNQFQIFFILDLIIYIFNQEFHIFFIKYIQSIDSIQSRYIFHSWYFWEYDNIILFIYLNFSSMFLLH